MFSVRNKFRKNLTHAIIKMNIEKDATVCAFANQIYSSNVQSYQEYTRFKAQQVEIGDSLGGISFMNVHRGVNMLQREKSYNNALKTGTSGHTEEINCKITTSDRVILYGWKIYLDCCATYGTTFILHL